MLVVGLRNMQNLVEGTSKIIGFNLLKEGAQAREPSWTINTPSSVCSIAFRPKTSNIIAVGLANGVIYLFNLVKLE